MSRTMLTLRIRAKHFPRGWSFVQGARCVPILVGVPLTGLLNTQAHKAGFYLSFVFVILGRVSSSTVSARCQHGVRMCQDVSPSSRPQVRSRCSSWTAGRVGTATATTSTARGGRPARRGPARPPSSRRTSARDCQVRQ